MNRETARLILIEELEMRKICAKMVSRNLTEQQQDARLNICADLLEQVAAGSELMDRVISGDESWFFQYDPETKFKSLEWHSKGLPRPKKARVSKLKVKCMLVCFFDSMRTVHKEWVPAGQTVNQYYYTEIPGKTEKEGHAGSSKHCEKLDPSSRQCASPFSVLRSTVFDIQTHYDDAAVSLLTLSHTLRLTFISKSKIGSERTPF